MSAIPLEALPLHELRERSSTKWRRYPDDVLPLSAADPARVAALAQEYGVVSSIGRLQKALDKLP